MRYAPLDELDDLSLPRTQPGLIRFCGAPKCRRRARPGGRHCPACHQAAVQRWRDGHRRAINTRRRDQAGGRSDEQRARDSARAQLAMALKRGSLTKGPCADCGAAEVTAYMADPQRALDVVWLCRADRRDSIERLATEAKRLAERTAWDQRRSAALAGLAFLPPAVQEQLRTAARRGVGGLTLSSSAPLYGMQLVRLFERNRDGQLGDGSALCAAAASSETI